MNNFKILYCSPGSKGEEDCADLSTSMKFGIHVDPNILNPFLRAHKQALNEATIFAKSNMANSRYVI